MKKVKPGDYVIAEVKNKRADDEEKKAKSILSRHLIKVTQVADDESEFYGMHEKDVHFNPQKVTLKPNQVILNLGSKPAEGMVYGCDVTDRYIGKKQHDTFGDIHFFVKPEREDAVSLWKSMDRITRKLEKLGIVGVLNLPLLHEVRNKRGKYAGIFHRSSNTEKRPHRIEYYLDAEVASYDYLIAHELGHVLHLVALHEHSGVNAAWVRLFNRSIKPRVVSSDSCARYLEELTSQEAPVSEWLRSQDDDEAKAELKLIFRWISQVQSVTVRDLDLLWGDGDGKEDVGTLWPTCSIHSKDIKPLITEYACVNHKETFAESFGLYMTGRELPKQAVTLLEKSISLAKTELKSFE